MKFFLSLAVLASSLLAGCEKPTPTTTDDVTDQIINGEEVDLGLISIKVGEEVTNAKLLANLVENDKKKLAQINDCTISPALPAGVLLDGKKCEFTGKATAEVAEAEYKLEAKKPKDIKAKFKLVVISSESKEEPNGGGEKAACEGGLAHDQSESRDRFSVAVSNDCAGAKEVQTRSCSDGTLSAWSGTFTEEVCRPFNGCEGGISHGASESRDRFSAAVSQNCTLAKETQTRSCNDGVFGAWSGSYSLESCVTDNAAPSGASISIEGGVSSTSSLSVSLTLAATDASEMKISESSDCSSGSYEAYNTSKSYTLPNANAVNTVYVMYKDSVGNESSCVSDTITHDNTPPSGASVSINAGATATNSASTTLTLAATGASEMYITNTAGCGSGGSWESYASSKNPWVLGSLNTTTSVYVKFKDSAGNESGCVSDDISHDNIPPSSPSLVINNGVPNTSSTSTSYVATAVDASEMLISSLNDCSSGSWISYSTSPQSLTIPSSLNTTTYQYAKFKDALGNESNCVVGSVRYVPANSPYIFPQHFSSNLLLHYNTSTTGAKGVKIYSKGNKIVITSLNGFYISSDDGASWSYKGLGNGLFAPATSIINVELHGESTIYVSDKYSTTSRLYVSYDNGNNFSLLTTYNTNFTSVKRSGDNIYVSTDSAGILYSSNAGASFLPYGTTEGLPSTNIRSLAIKDSTLFMTSYTGVYKSALNLSSVSAALLSYSTMDSRLASDDTNIYLAGNSGLAADVGFYISSNDGANWTKRTSSNSNMLADVVLDVVAANNNVYIGYSGSGISFASKTSDFTSFTNISQATVNGGANASSPSYLGVTPTKIYATEGGNGNRTSYSTLSNINNTWSLIDMMPTVSIIEKHGNLMFISGGNSGTYRSLDGGVTWSKVVYPLVAEPAIGNIFIDPTNSKVYVATSAYGLLISSDNGASWTVKNNTNGLALNTNFVAASGSNIYVSTDSGLWVSNDSGDNWTLKTNANGLPVSRNRLVFVSGTTVIVIGNGTSANSYIAKSTNNGGSFTSISNPISTSTISKAEVKGNEMLVYTATELHYSSNLGSAFTVIQTSDAGECGIASSSIVCLTSGNPRSVTTWNKSTGVASTSYNSSIIGSFTSHNTLLSTAIKEFGSELYIGYSRGVMIFNPQLEFK